MKLYIDHQLYDATPKWQSYAYLGIGSHEYRPCRYFESGGFNDEAYVTADDSLWTIDTPASPQSILALIIPSMLWTKSPPMDLRHTTISFSLRGDDLQLYGATCYFWIVTFLPASTRWHYTSQPLTIPEGKWSELQTIVLNPRESLWHCSFSMKNPRVSLNDTLDVCMSFGFSFVGFSEKVTGKLSLSEFTIHKNLNTRLEYFANFHNFRGWFTLSRIQGCQIPAPIDAAGRITLKDENYLVLTTVQGMTYMYLAFVPRLDSTKGISLYNSLLFFMLGLRGASPMDYKQGNMHFFLENTQTETIWILRQPVNQEITMGRLLLRDNESDWFRLTGNAPLNSVMAGGANKFGYDYMGLMLVGVTAIPTGNWRLFEFSLSQQA